MVNSDLAAKIRSKWQQYDCGVSVWCKRILWNNPLILDSESGFGDAKYACIWTTTIKLQPMLITWFVLFSWLKWLLIWVKCFVLQYTKNIDLLYLTVNNSAHIELDIDWTCKHNCVIMDLSLSCTQQRKTTCLCSIWKSPACARASKLTTKNV